MIVQARGDDQCIVIMPADARELPVVGIAWCTKADRKGLGLDKQTFDITDKHERVMLGRRLKEISFMYLQEKCNAYEYPRHQEKCEREIEHIEEFITEQGL